MNFVLDASLAMTFLLEDEATAETDALLDGFAAGSTAFVPALWRWEVGSVLLLAARRKRITFADVQRHLAQLKKLPIQLDDPAIDAVWNSTLNLAEKHKLTCYDAAYLEAALRRNLPLGTLDRELRAAAKIEKIKTVP